jgi:hypothetical protein
MFDMGVSMIQTDKIQSRQELTRPVISTTFALQNGLRDYCSSFIVGAIFELLLPSGYFSTVVYMHLSFELNSYVTKRKFLYLKAASTTIFHVSTTKEEGSSPYIAPKRSAAA